MYLSHVLLIMRGYKLTLAQRKHLDDILDSGPAAYGLDTGIWTSPIIAWVIEEEFGIHYHPGYVRKLLHRSGFSVQRPRRVLAHANGTPIPALKKSAATKTGR
jgi:transposase